MSGRPCKTTQFGRVAVWLVLAAPAFGSGAAAQGLFDTLFGSHPPAASHAVPAQPRVMLRREPGISITVTPSRSAGGGTVYCVRLCDGRYFPIPRIGGARNASARLCEAICPATPTRVFHGNPIELAVAADGGRYRDLDEAFAYRKQMVPDCSCIGAGATGTASVSLKDDPTLRDADLIATADGTIPYGTLRKTLHAEDDLASADLRLTGSIPRAKPPHRRRSTAPR